jgi:hypothetical protein
MKRIYPLNVHGTIVYLTREEDLLLKWLYWTMIGLIPLVIVFNVLFEPFKKP